MITNQNGPCDQITDWIRVGKRVDSGVPTVLDLEAKQTMNEIVLSLSMSVNGNGLTMSIVQRSKQHFEIFAQGDHYYSTRSLKKAKHKVNEFAQMWLRLQVLGQFIFNNKE